MPNLFQRSGRPRIGQVYSNIQDSLQVEIFGKTKNDKWKTRVLTAKPGKYAGTHSLSNKTLAAKFKLIS